MRLPVAGRTGRRARLLLLVTALLAAALAALWAAPLALLPLAAALTLVLWDRAALEHDLRQLAAAVSGDAPELKLEVGDDAWGELCYALNRARQQRRARQQLATLLPALPLARAARLADAGVPPEGLRCEVAVLALAIPDGDALAHLHETAAAVLVQAQLHEALMLRAGGRILLIFGAFAAGSPAANLRAAQDAARALAPIAAHLALTAGTARAVALPGLGLSVLGGPVDQALSLPPSPPGQLLCNEDAYLGLRRLGVLPAQTRMARRPSADDRPAYVVQL